jgi:ATP-dependent metalloprotease
LERRKEWTPEQLKRVSAHEAGHAIVRLVTTGKWSSLGFVQISQRVEGNEGSTHENEDDEHYMTRDGVINSIAVMMAGGQAENLLLGSTGNGHSADLEDANNLADSAVSSWGFGNADTNTRVYANERYWSSNQQDDNWNVMASRLLLEGEVVARTLLRAEKEALMVLAENLAREKVADSNKVREWLHLLLPKVTE